MLSGFIPGVPAEHADAEGRGKLHVSGCASGEADDSGAGGGDEGGVKLASASEAADVEVNEGDEDEGEAGGGQSRGPVVDAEFFEGEHGAPVVEGWFFEPGLSPKHGRDVVVALEHFARHLRITRFVRADQSKARAAKDGNEAIEKKNAVRMKRVAASSTVSKTGKRESM